MFKKKQNEEVDDAALMSLDNDEPDGDWMAEPESVGQLNLDLYETEEEFVIVAPVAGVGAEDLEIKFKDNVLSIRGERKADKEVNSDSYHLQETYWGAFSRTLELPSPVAADKAKVTQDNGVLHIRLPKISPSHEVVLKVKPKDA